MVDSDKVESLDAQLNDLRSGISDLGYQIDSYKTKTAAALGITFRALRYKLKKLGID